jgi:hypothetical protein
LADQRRFLDTLAGFLLGGCVAGLVFSGGPLYAAPAAWWYSKSCPSDGTTFCVDPQSRMYQVRPPAALAAGAPRPSWRPRVG